MNGNAYILCGECPLYEAEPGRVMYEPQYGLCTCDGERRDRCDFCPKYERKIEDPNELAGLNDVCTMCGMHSRNNVSALKLLEDLKIPYDRAGYNGKIRFDRKWLPVIKARYDELHPTPFAEVPEDLPEICTTQHVMDILGVSNSTAYNYVRESGIPYRMGKMNGTKAMNFEKQYMQQVVDLWNKKKGAQKK